jgi:hypothetical protein
LVNSARINYTPRTDATPEAELNALAAVYKLVLNCHDKKKAAEHSQPSGPDDAEDLENDRTANTDSSG